MSVLPVAGCLTSSKYLVYVSIIYTIIRMTLTNEFSLYGLIFFKCNKLFVENDFIRYISIIIGIIA